MSEVVISREKTFTMGISELKKQAQLIHPVGFYILAMKLFEDGSKDESIKWFYVGSLRYRHLLSSVGEDPYHPDNELFGKVQFEIGGVILEYAGGDPQFWAKQINEAIAWDEYNFNYFYPKKNNPEDLQKVIAGMHELQQKLIDEKEDIIKQRIENNAEVRV